MITPIRFSSRASWFPVVELNNRSDGKVGYSIYIREFSSVQFIIIVLGHTITEIALPRMPLGRHVNVPGLFWQAVSYLSRLTWKPVALDLHNIFYYTCTIHIMVGGVANYYTTKNVDRLKVNWGGGFFCL